MQGTRERILALLLERRESRVEDLADVLGITPVAVRRHLDHLRADGLVDVRAVRQATGRPYHAFFPTERAAGALPAAYASLLERMLRSLGEHDEVIATVMDSIAESLATKHRDEVLDMPDPEQRVAQVTASLRSEGILDGWHPEADGFHLVNGTCPYRHAAEISRLPCESDRKAIELLLGLDVEQLNRIVDGSPICEYLVRAVRGGEPDTLAAVTNERGQLIQIIELSEGVR